MQRRIRSPASVRCPYLSQGARKQWRSRWPPPERGPNGLPPSGSRTQRKKENTCALVLLLNGSLQALSERLIGRVVAKEPAAHARAASIPVCNFLSSNRKI